MKAGFAYFSCNQSTHKRATDLYSDLMLGQKPVSLRFATLKTVLDWDIVKRVILDTWLCHHGTFQGSVVGFLLSRCWDFQHICMRDLDILYPAGLHSDGCPQITS